MPSEDRAALLERETRFTQEHAEIVKHFGQRYTKVAPIWAFQTDRPCTVVTREGESQELPAGYFVATDGKTVWPVAADFMASSYALSTPAGTQEPDADADALAAWRERLWQAYARREVQDFGRARRRKSRY